MMIFVGDWIITTKDGQDFQLEIRVDPEKMADHFTNTRSKNAFWRKAEEEGEARSTAANQAVVATARKIEDDPE